jgi:hypothetical protein
MVPLGYSIKAYISWRITRLADLEAIKGLIHT